MVSKNNRIERMEQAAERQSHFGIRKLTIGAASVLLGTTLWLGNNANVAKADINADNGDIDEANQETANPIQYGAASAKKAVVVANNDSAKTAQDEVNDQGANTAIKKTQKAGIQADSSTKNKPSEEAKIASNEIEKSANKKEVANSQGTTQNKSDVSAAQSTPSSVKTTADQQKAAQAQVEKGVVNTNNQKQNQTTEQTKAVDQATKIDQAAQAGQNKLTTPQLDITKAALSGVKDLKADNAVTSLNTSALTKLQKAAGDKADEQVILRSGNIDEATAKKLAQLYGISLVQTNTPTSDSSSNKSYTSSQIWDALGKGLQVAGKTITSPGVITNGAKLVKDIIQHPTAENITKDAVALLGAAGAAAFQNALEGKDNPSPTDPSGVRSVSTWEQFVSAVNDDKVNNIQLTNNITGLTALTVDRTNKLTIESAPAKQDANTKDASAVSTPDVTKYSLSMGINPIQVGGLITNPTVEFKNLVINSNNSTGAVQSTNEANTVIFNNVDEHGASLYSGKGNVEIKGNVTSDFNSFTPITRDEFKNEMGTNDTQGVNLNNWYNANIIAKNVIIDDNASLTTTRNQNGHGIVLTGGNNHVGQGTLSVGKNATLNITLKNGTATGAETNMDPEDANTAVWAAHNGNFTTATGAKVVINAGHGRGIVFDEPFGGTRNHQVATPSDWYRNRYDVGQQNESGANNTFKLGDFTDFKMLSRDGILLGNNATMNTGEHSKVSLENYGNGVGLDADAQANIVIGPHTDFEMRSDGKNHSGIWNAGNYIGLGENAQFTVAHDATFRFKLTNAWNGSSLNYADNFNIVSVKRDSNPTVNIENNAIFDGESDYRNIFGEILSFSYNDGPRTSTVNINGARYVNFQRHGATTPGGWQNVVAYDKDGKHSGNLFYSWPANTWNVNGNTYNVYKWSDETESNNTFDSSSYDALVKSIEDLNASSSDYWTNVKNLTMGVNMHRSNLQDMTANTQIGVKQGWNASDKNGKGFDTEFSQRLALVATHIPTEDDKVTDEDGDYNVIIVEDPNLAPGQTQIIQQGKKGRTITVDRTYYNVDLSDPTKPQRTVDTTKGNNGHEIKVVHLGDSQDEIIAVGPQTATVNYVTKDGKAVTGKDGKAIIGTVTASPVETTGANNEIVFNADGTPSAANVNYNESPDLQKAIDAGYIKVAGQASDSTKTAQGLNWDYAISAAGIAQNANKYNITGLTKDAIIKAAESGQTINIAGPVYKVVLEKPEKQNVNITVNYVDDDNNQNVITIGNKTYTDNVNGKPGTPLTYTTQPNIDAITGTGKYRLVANASIPANFPDAPITYTVHFAHVITPVGPNNPDPHGNDGLKKTDLQKTGTKQIHYVLDDGSTTDPSKMTKMVYYDPNITDITDTVTYNGTGYVDAVTGKLVNAKQDANGNWIKDGDADGKITWAPATDADKTYKGAATKVSTGYIADKASVGDETVPTNTDGTPKDGTTEYVIYKTMGKIIPIDKKTGKTITGQPQPQYKNDPTDPTKADPTNPITDIPGYTISNPQTDPNVDPTKKTVTTPTDPTKNTNVEYEQNAKDQKAALKLYDDTAKQWLTIDGTTTTADTDIATATGKPSTDIDFVSGNLDKLASIESLMNKGYAYVATTKGSDPSKNDGYVQLDPMTVMNGVLTKDYSAINAAFGPYDTDDSTTQTFIVHIKHTYTPVNPTNPGNPGQPLNQDPNGPKYPDGTSKADLVKNVTRTITYTVADDPSKAPSPIVENVTFTGQGYLDNVTGKWINVDDNGNILNTPSEGLTWTYVDGNRKDGKGKTYSFNSVPYKDIPGYYVSSITSNYVEGEKSTPSDVDYSDGNGGVKKYDVDASKDLRNLSINVIYTKNKEHMGQVNVVFHDDTTDTTIPNVGHQTGEQKVGDPINYDPKVDQTKLENQGYVYVSTDGSLPADGKIPEGETVVTIHMRHAAVPITPNTPSTDVPSGTPEDALPQHLKVTATRPIEYKLDDGTATDPTQMKDMTGLPSDTIRNQTVVFTGTVYVDKITGQMVHAIADSNSKTGYVVNTNDKSTVAIQWTTTPQDGKFAGFNAPTVDGYNITQNSTISERQVVRPSQNFKYDTIYVVYKKGAEVKKGSVQVHYHDDTDNTDITEVNGSSIGYNSGEKPEKTPVNYTTTSDLKKLTDAGYVFVSQDKDIPTSISDQNVVVTVHVKHGVQPVNPDTPPKDIPKTPDGKQSVDPNTLTKKINLTVNYVNSDNSQFTATTPANAKQTVTFTGTDYIDKITGKQVNAKQENGQWVIDDSNPANPQTVWTADKTSFDKVVSPVEQNYHLISVSDHKDGNDVAAISGLTKDSSDITVTVTYAPNGHIIPYYPDPNDPTKPGEKIPNVPSPQYPTDPTDPSKVKPDEPVPNVPGYTPSTPTVTPTDPGKDTPVIYHPDVQDQTVTIKYIDDATGDAHTDLSSYNKSITAKPGAVLNYSTQPSITELENKGYVLVSDNFNVTTMPEKGGSYEVHLNHKTTTITPGKPGHPDEPINPNDPDPKGPKWPQGTDAKSLTKDGSEIIHYVYSDGKPAAKDSVQNTQFEHTLVFDNVTGKQIEDKGWSPESHKFNDITSPTINGYHADKAIVEGATVTPDNPTSETTVTYTKNGEEIRNKQNNPASQTVRYVDDQGKQLLDPKSQSFTFTYSGDTYDKETNALISSGKWNATGHKFNAEDVVKIPGYVAVSGYTYNNGKYTAGGFNASNTGSKDDNNQVFTVVYKKIGKIIPVDPTGNPIPNAPTPTYTNDPTDPTKVTPDEPTPTVPGWTPDKPTVTPDKPTEDTPVIYRQAEEQKAQVQYIDLDDNKVMSKSNVLTGKAGDKIDYSTATDIANYEKQGYVLANDGFSGNPIFDNVKDNTQIFKVTFHHGQIPVNPNTPDKHGVDPNQIEKNVKETVHYTGAGDNTPGDNVQNSKWTRTVTVDTVTNKIVENGQYTTDWSIPKGEKIVYDQVNTPVINGYHADQASIPATAVTQEDITKVVNYTPNGKIIPVNPSGKPIPNVPTPQYPTDPSDPTKVTPDEPVPTIPGYTPKVPSVTPTDPGKDTPVPYTPETPAKDQVAIVNYVDADENNKKITDSGNLTGKAGSKIDYSTASTIQDLENKGYVLVNDGFPAGAVYDNDDNTTQTYTVVLKHGTVPVTPDKPGKPGEPINPNYPDGPKWPDGTNAESLTQTYTRTIHYTGAGDQTPKDVVQTVNFTAQGVLDKVTGKWTTPLTWSADQTLSAQPTKVINGYHIVSVDKDSTDGINVDAKTISHQNGQETVTVTYAPNGKIIPVDPNNKPIPDAPTPQYPTDPENPKGVTPNEPIPTVPGYHPQNPSPITPKNPGTNTPVIYVPDEKDVTTVVHYLDQDEGNKQILTSPNLTGKEGTKIGYSSAKDIKTLEAQGYVVVDNGYDPNGNIPNFDSKVPVYNIVLRHGTTPVTPDKPGKPGEPINPNDPDGPKYPNGSDQVIKNVTRTIHYVDSNKQELKNHPTISQTVEFDGEGVLDNVTGQWKTPLTWSVKGDKDFAGVKSPVVQGYHLVSVDRDSKDNVNVDLATPSQDTNNYDVYVTYAQNGKIIPVDPSGKPIPNVPTPQYPTDPSNPTKVTPDEPVPTVPGKTPTTPTVTPSDPGTDTLVVYNTPQKALVNYIDADENNKVITTSGDLTGDAGAKIDYSTESTIQDLTNKGYVLVNDGFPAGAVYNNDDNTTQTYTVVLKHGTTTITPDKPGKPGDPINPNDPDGPKFPQGTDENSVKRTGTQTIHYTGAGDQTPEDNVESFTFTKTMVVDNVTGKVITDGSWNVTSHTFGNVDTPVIDGYHADKRTAGGTTITPEDLNKTVIVNYSQNGKIIPVDPSGKPIPNVPTPTYPTDPTDPTKVVPDEPVPTIPGMTPSTPTVTPTDPGKDTPVPYNPVVNNKGEVNVFVHDNTTGQNLTDYGYNSGSEDVGTKVSYDKDKVITELTNKGYKVINPDVTIPGEIAKGTTNVTIYVEHDVVPVNPTNPGKPGEPINPNDPNGPKWPDDTDAKNLSHQVTRTINFVDSNGKALRTPINQTITFTATGELDKVTGKWTKTLTWSPDQQVNGMDVPFIDGYHVVNISKDGNGLKSITSVTLNHNDKDYSVNVVYGKNGHIIPVDPNGNPIPDAPQPQFPTDPSDPSKTIPGTKPSVPGYQPESGKPGDPVDPGNNPGDNVNVPYTKNPDTVVATGSVTYIDKTTGQTLKIDDLKGNVGDKITYTTAGTIADYENKGYKLVENTFKDGQETFTKDGNKFTVTLEHATAPVGPNNPHEPDTPINPNDPNGPKWPEKDNYSKDYTSTVHFVDDQGKQLKPDKTQTSTWTRTLIIDKVTGEITNPDESWKSNIDTYKSTTVPVIDGYVADTKSKNGNTVGKTLPGEKAVEKNIEDSVVYHKIGKIVPVDPSGNPIPGADQPQYKNDPTDPTKVTPNEPVPNVLGYTPSQNTITPVDPAKDTPVVYNQNVTPTPTPEPTPVTVTGKQTITFVDGDNGNTPLRDPDVQTHKFTNGESSYTFGTINVPVIDGYVAEVKTAGGKTVTPDNPDANVTVVYHKIGKIVPVDPSGNPIPGADQPQYKNDPTDPTKVTPNEPVPNVPGYTPSQNSVTPVDPTKDTQVIYTKKETPKKPETPKTPKTPEEPSTPEEPKKPTTPKKENNKPKPTTPKPTPNYNNNIAPHSQNGYWNNNIAPHATSVNGWTNNIGPHGETVDANGNIVAPNGEIIGYVDANGNPHYTKSGEKSKTLPQTGEKTNEAAAVLGGLSAGLGLIGLAGVKKRRRKED